jgi:hypothetical protein
MLCGFYCLAVLLLHLACFFESERPGFDYERTDQNFLSKFMVKIDVMEKIKKASSKKEKNKEERRKRKRKRKKRTSNKPSKNFPAFCRTCWKGQKGFEGIHQKLDVQQFA